MREILSRFLTMAVECSGGCRWQWAAFAQYLHGSWEGHLLSARNARSPRENREEFGDVMPRRKTLRSGPVAQQLGRCNLASGT